MLTLTTGTSIAQAIPVALSPVLTRLYGPAEFGIYGLFVSLAAFAVIAATGRYDLAVVLPREESDASYLVKLSIILSVAFCLLLFLVLIPFAKEAALFLGQPDIEPWLRVLPLSALLGGAYGALNYWQNRQQGYALMGRNRIVQTGGAGASQLGLGVAGSGAGGLIVGNLVGLLLSTWVFAIRFFRRATEPTETAWNFGRMLVLARQYAFHPLHILPAQWVSMGAIQLPVLVIAKLADSSVVGLYSVAMYLISIPTNLIATAIGDVYREKASVAYREKGEFRALYLETLGFAVRIAIIPLAVIFVLAPGLFSFVLGESWRSAGEIARLLSISALFQFVFTSVDKGAIIVGATRYIAAWSLARLAAFATVGVLAIRGQWEVGTFIVGTVIINSVLYLVDAAYQFRLSRGAHDHL